MPSNDELTDLISRQLGVCMKNRMPRVKEILKAYGMELLPFSAPDMLPGAVVERNFWQWEKKEQHLLDFFPAAIPLLHQQLMHMPKVYAVIPDFEFVLDEVKDLHFDIPSLFHFKWSGELQHLTALTIQVKGVKRIRLTDFEQPGADIALLLSTLEEERPQWYREKIKYSYLTQTLFYAEEIVLHWRMQKGARIEWRFHEDELHILEERNGPTERYLHCRVSDENRSPFAAILKQGKDFFSKKHG